MLRSYKAIAEQISKAWGGIEVSVPSVINWSKMITDPLPVKRIKPNPDGKRSLIVADSTAISKWAQRRLA